MARYLPAAVLLLVSASLASAESWGPYIAWKGWSIGSNEHGVTPGHSLRALVDGDPGTAWVYCKPSAEERARGAGRVPQIWLRPTQPVAADELWLRNGFDKSDELFRRHNRVVEVSVGPYAEGRRVRLTDRRGWHRISLQEGLRRPIIIELTRQVRGPDDELCVSELALYHHGRRLDFRVPRHVLYNDGGGCCCGSDDYALVSPAWHTVATLHGSELTEPRWDASGRFVTALTWDQRAERHQLAAADLLLGRVLCVRDLPRGRPDARYRQLHWVDGHRVRYFVDEQVTAGGRQRWVRRGYCTVKVR